MRNLSILLIKLLLTAATLVYGIVPAIADLNETHLYNPQWSPHARVHGAWFLFFGAFMALFSLFHLWLRDDLIRPIIIGLCYVGGFWGAFLTSSFYGGALVDDNGIEVRVLGLESNVFVFSVLAVVFLTTLPYGMRHRSTARN
ncbi:MAG: DUF6640 family protein [Pseudomonadota bacterium]